MPKKKAKTRIVPPQPVRTWWGNEASYSGRLPPNPLHAELQELFSAVRKPADDLSDDPSAMATLLNEVRRHSIANTVRSSELLELVRQTLPESKRKHAEDITNLLLTTRRAQLIVLFLVRRGHPAVTSSAILLEAAKDELARARFKAKDTRRRVLARLRLAHPRFGEKRLGSLVERDKAVLTADAVFFFARQLRDTKTEAFNAEWSGLSEPQSHVRVAEERAWVPLLVHELRYDFSLGLQTIADLLIGAQIVKVMSLDEVSKILARSKYQR